MEPLVQVVDISGVSGVLSTALVVYFQQGCPSADFKPASGMSLPPLSSLVANKIFEEFNLSTGNFGME